MMKKQLNRMRQIANQTVFKAEKTEVLSEEHVKVEKRLENVKVISHVVVKKLQGCMQGPPGIDNDKRLKRLPLVLLAASLSEGYSSLEDVPLGKVLQICGETELNLGLVLSKYESQLESDVLEPLLNLAEEYIPNIQKQRKHLAKLVLDMDSAKNRYSQAAKAMSSGTTALTAAKLESLREEMEDEENKVELGKLLEAQAEYHRKSLEILDKTLPRAKKEQENCIKPCYGLELERHLSITNREIAFPIEASVVALLETGLQEEGLFRIAAANSKLRKLKAGLDCCMVETDVLNDPHAFAGALKSYLRELPEPLMTFQLFDEWIQASHITDNQEKLQRLWTICDKLPKANKDNFSYLIKFLAKLAEHHEVNKMSPSNISIVLGPNLLWAPSEGSADVMSSMSIQVVGIVETILQYADWFFHNDVEFDQTAIYSMAPQVNQALSSIQGAGHTQSTSSSVDQENGEQRGTDVSRLRPLSIATDADLSRELQRKDGASKMNASPSFVRKGAGSNANSVSPNVAHKGYKKPAPAPPKASGPTLTSLVQSTTPVVEHLSASATQHDTSPHQPGHQSSVLISPPSPGVPEAPSSSPKARPHSQPDLHSLAPGRPLAQDVKAAPTFKPPVPKPRVRPTMPPPPQPSNTPGDMSDDSCEEISTATTGEEDSTTLIGVSTEKPKHTMSMEELDSESTAL
uniref:Uncharacterized protein n=1 Tax=Eptatretus burgeri TaxID=7764 RepID=A0A8C4R1R5_EPTBU